MLSKGQRTYNCLHPTQMLEAGLQTEVVNTRYSIYKWKQCGIDQKKKKKAIKKAGSRLKNPPEPWASFYCLNHRCSNFHFFVEVNLIFRMKEVKKWKNLKNKMLLFFGLRNSELKLLSWLRYHITFIKKNLFTMNQNKILGILSWHYKTKRNTIYEISQ